MGKSKVKPLSKDWDIIDYDDVGTYPDTTKFIKKSRLTELLKAVVGEIEKSEAKQHPDGSSGAIVAYQECLAILDIYFGRVYPDLFAGEREK